MKKSINVPAQSSTTKRSMCSTAPTSLSVTITHIINNKSGMSFTSYSHTGLPVAVLAQGVGSDVFNGYSDNTDIYNKLADLLNIA